VYARALDSPVAAIPALASAATLREILTEVRGQGFSVVVGELEYGLTGIGVPVYDSSGNVVAGLGCATSTAITGPEEMVESRLDKMLQAAEQIQSLFKTYPSLEAAFRVVPSGDA
jgi:DNA-binding IclR family transcriptional regulator